MPPAQSERETRRCSRRRNGKAAYTTRLGSAESDKADLTRSGASTPESLLHTVRQLDRLADPPILTVLWSPMVTRSILTGQGPGQPGQRQFCAAARLVPPKCDAFPRLPSANAAPAFRVPSRGGGRPITLRASVPLFSPHRPFGCRRVAMLSACQSEGERPTLAVDAGVGLDRPTTAGAADRLRRSAGHGSPGSPANDIQPARHGRCRSTPDGCRPAATLGHRRADAPRCSGAEPWAGAAARLLERGVVDRLPERASYSRSTSARVSPTSRSVRSSRPGEAVALARWRSQAATRAPSCAAGGAGRGRGVRRRERQ